MSNRLRNTGCTLACTGWYHCTCSECQSIWIGIFSLFRERFSLPTMRYIMHTFPLSVGGAGFFKRTFHSMDGINTSFTDSEAGGADPYNSSSSSSSSSSGSALPVIVSVSSLPPSPTAGSPEPEEAEYPAAYPTPPSSPELTAAADSKAATKAKSAPADCRQSAVAAVVDPRKWRASSLQSLTDHLAVLGKTFTNRR